MSDEIRYVDANGNLRQLIKDTWKSNAGDFMHVEGGGYAIVAMAEDRPVGMIPSTGEICLNPYLKLWKISSISSRSMRSIG